jgi:hypothetical protein
VKLLKAVLALLSFAGSLFIGLTAVEQFEHFQEASRTYHTPFHLIDIVALVTVAVALLAFAVVAWQLSDDFEESAIGFDDYVRSVVFGTFGVMAVGLAVYQSDINEGKALPRHIGNGYHSGNTDALFAIGIVLVLTAVYYLMRGPDRRRDEREAAPQAPEAPGQSREDVASAAPARPHGNRRSSDTHPLTPIEEVAPGSEGLTAVISFEFDDDRVMAVYTGGARDVEQAAEHFVDEFFPEENAG